MPCQPTGREYTLGTQAVQAENTRWEHKAANALTRPNKATAQPENTPWEHRAATAPRKPKQGHHTSREHTLETQGCQGAQEAKGVQEAKTRPPNKQRTHLGNTGRPSREHTLGTHTRPPQHNRRTHLGTNALYYSPNPCISRVSRTTSQEHGE